MKKGIVLGKFMPLHKGHLALIDFAHSQCGLLYVILCYTTEEPIGGQIREQWLSESLKNYYNTRLIALAYDEKELPNTSESSRLIAEKWAGFLRRVVPDATAIFTSEPYGAYMAEYMGIEHFLFDQKRVRVPVSASQIREHPIKYWPFIAPGARPYFVKKVALLGSESTGKTTLAERLAKHYNTAFVPEMAREIIAKTEACTFEDLNLIAALHATTILKTIPETNRLLFVDTDLTITRSYASFLFNKKLETDQWIEEANKFDLYLFLEADCDYVQDGTRIAKKERNRLSDHHKEECRQAGIPFISVYGNWEERFEKAKEMVDEAFFL